MRQIRILEQPQQQKRTKKVYMNKLNLNSLKEVNGGDWVSGICHIADQGYNSQAYVQAGSPGTLNLIGGTKQIFIPGFDNNGLNNTAVGPLGPSLQPLPGSC
jgi:hypothetical protein